MKFQPYLAPGFSDREEMREAARQMRRDGKSSKQIAEALGFKTGGRTLTEWLRDIPPPEWTKRPQAKDDLREVAVSMRLEGHSYREIKEVLGVSKGSLSLWLKNVLLTEEQQLELKRRCAEGNLRRGAEIRARNEARRSGIEREAAKQIESLAESELFVAGVIAYMAEGGKHKPWHPSGRIRFINSDPRFIKMFIRWLDLMEVSRASLTYTLSIHESADIPGAMSFWAEELGISKSDFNKPTLKKHNPKTQRKNVEDDYHGCLTVGVLKSGILYRRLIGWFDGICAALEQV